MNDLTNYPLLKKFELDGFTYIYDARANYLCEFDKSSFKQLVSNNFNSSDTYFMSLREKGLFCEGSLETVTADNYKIDKDIDEVFENVLPRKFILEITENCNLRCTYCFNTIGNSPRKHTSATISESNAIKAIDFYFKIFTDVFSRIPECERDNFLEIVVPNLSWWGGEPLMNFPIIKSTYQYFNNLPWDEFGISKKHLTYSIVTNFTFITPEIFDFLIENDIYMMISLDGGKLEHDKHRKTINGSGTFDVVKRNLDYLLDNYSDFCKKRVIVQAVYMPGNSRLSDRNSFLYTYLHNDDGSKKVLKVTQYPQKIENSFISEAWIKDLPSAQERIANFKKLCDKLNLLSDQELAEFVFNQDDINEEFRSIYLLENSLVVDKPFGSNNFNKLFTCPIGRDVIYVSVNGELHVCNKTDSSMPIGHIQTGFCKPQITEMLESYLQVLEAHCNKCWAIHFCKMCPANLMYNSSFRSPSTFECTFLQSALEWDFLKYLVLIKYSALFERIKTLCFVNDKINFLNYSYPVFINQKLRKDEKTEKNYIK